MPYVFPFLTCNAVKSPQDGEIVLMRIKWEYVTIFNCVYFFFLLVILINCHKMAVFPWSAGPIALHFGVLSGIKYP